ncbi:helix-turn-helix domain-containing protein [Amycolatopsis sp. NPDC006125]|uniref:helix-turn-helix domain-containing protein n=1 Tax=Amycolatopsis sp. NPDC006125 TaxID=3156730 RepID=UPI0033ACEE57
MSIEAISWALNRAPIPTCRKDASSLAVVLIGLANHADPWGRNAFPSAATLTRYTRLSESTVRRSLDRLEALGLITPSDPAIVAAHIKRADRRPQGWDLQLSLGGVDNPPSGVSARHPADLDGVSSAPNGVSSAGERGVTTTPEPSYNPSRNRPARERAPETARSPLPPVCGQCDARESDPVSARVVWDADDRCTPCPRCHPSRIGGAR